MVIEGIGTLEMHIIIIIIIIVVIAPSSTHYILGSLSPPVPFRTELLLLFLLLLRF